MSENKSQYFRLPFGKFKGMKLWEVAEAEGGLTYLDWLIGYVDLLPDTEQAIRSFLADPVVKRHLESQIEDSQSGDGSN